MHRDFRMCMSAKQPRAFRADGPIAESCALGGAGNDADVLRHHRRRLSQHQQHQIRRHDGSDYRATVAQQVDHLVQVLDLQAVIERVAEAVGPVKQRKRAEDDERDARQGMAEDCGEMRVARRGQPAQRERDTERNTRLGMSSAEARRRR